MLPEWFPEIGKYLPGANVPMAFVTIVFVQVVKLVLPSEIPEDVKVPVSRWTVADAYKAWPLVATFVVASAISVAFDPHQGQPIVAKVGDALQTAAYAVCGWEVWDNIVRPAIKKIAGK